MAHIDHCTAEINTAISEGYYVRLFPPAIAPIQAENGEVVDVEFCFQYDIEKLDEKRIKRVDYRNEIDQKRNPDFQPPGGFTG